MLSYYTAVGFLYYRADLLNLLRGTGTLRFRRGKISLSPAGSSIDRDPALPQDLKNEILALSDGTDAGRNKAEFLYGLRRILLQYNVGAQPELQEPLTKFIRESARESAGLSLEADEINVLWRG